MIQLIPSTARPDNETGHVRSEGTELKSLDKTLSLLQLFSDDHPEWRLQELSRAAGMPLSTVHRIMGVLQRHGLVSQDPAARSYRLGYAAIDLGRRAARGLPLRSFAEPVMTQLARETGETVVLTVPNEAHSRAICVARKDSSHDLRFHLDVGDSSYLHAGASSKVLLAFLPRDEVVNLLATEGLPRLAQGTITDGQELFSELERIRSRGYAFSREETDEGAWGVAVPILDRQGEAFAALGVAAPTSRYDDDMSDRYVRLTLSAAAELRRSMGIT